MSKRPDSSLSPEVAAAVQAAQAALAAVPQPQPPQNKPKKKPPPPTRKQAAKATGDPKPSSSKHGFRGVPQPLDFSLGELRDDQLLTEFEVAALTRLSTSSFEAWRKRPDHPLKWTKITGGRVRYRAGDVRQFLASGYRPRRGRPRKKDSAPRGDTERTSRRTGRRDDNRRRLRRLAPLKFRPRPAEARRAPRRPSAHHAQSVDRV